MQRGVVYGVLAGALWGMVFLVPRLLTDFSPLLLSAGRYTMYGLVSLAAALPVARSLLVRLTREDLVALVRLAVIGNVAYYMLLSGAVHLIGIAPSSLIVGASSSGEAARALNNSVTALNKSCFACGDFMILPHFFFFAPAPSSVPVEVMPRAARAFINRSFKRWARW